MVDDRVYSLMAHHVNMSDTTHAHSHSHRIPYSEPVDWTALFSGLKNAKYGNLKSLIKDTLRFTDSTVYIFLFIFHSVYFLESVFFERNVVEWQSVRSAVQGKYAHVVCTLMPGPHWLRERRGSSIESRSCLFSPRTTSSSQSYRLFQCLSLEYVTTSTFENFLYPFQSNTPLVFLLIYFNKAFIVISLIFLASL